MSKSSRAPKGMIARRSQDRSHPSVTITEFVEAPQRKATSKRTTVLCSKCNKPISFIGSIPDVAVCSECKNKVNQAVMAEQKRIAAEAEAKRQEELNSRIWRKCRVCGKEFYITAKKAKMLEENGMALFACCYACQKAKQAVTEGVK